MRALSVLCLFVMASCAPRPAAHYAPSVPEAHLQTLYVATQKALDRTGQTFGAKRSGEVRYFRADISIPRHIRPVTSSGPTGRLMRRPISSWRRRMSIRPPRHSLAM